MIWSGLVTWLMLGTWEGVWGVGANYRAKARGMFLLQAQLNWAPLFQASEAVVHYSLQGLRHRSTACKSSLNQKNWRAYDRSWCQRQPHLHLSTELSWDQCAATLNWKKGDSLREVCSARHPFHCHFIYFTNSTVQGSSWSPNWKHEHPCDLCPFAHTSSDTLTEHTQHGWHLHDMHIVHIPDKLGDQWLTRAVMMTS